MHTDSTRQIVRARAPLRIGLGGGGTDVSPYADEQGGLVLNATINRYAHVTIVPNDTGQITLRSLDYGQQVRYDAQADDMPDGYEMELAKGVIRRLGVDKLGKSFDLYTHTDCPPGSGLGASSTMVVALVGAFDAWLKRGYDRYELARLAFEIERVDLGMKGGKQDQYAAAFGGFNFMEFRRDLVLVNPLRMPVEHINELEHSLVLAYTGRSRDSSTIIENQIANYRRGAQERVDAMDQIKALALEAKRALLMGCFREFGMLLHEVWKQKKRMSDKISNPFIDKLYNTALEAGALGGKISGAGGGGFMFFFAEFDRKHDVEAALKAHGAEPVHFGFTDTGLQTWIRT